MSQVIPNQAFVAFESQLKTLCLKEFPCGLGSWREGSKKQKKHPPSGNILGKFSVTLKDYGSHHEKTEMLEELVTIKRSPWNLDYSWSDEAKQLREIAVRSPWLIDENFVLSHFRTLRIVDKGVTDVNDEFLKFHHLEELTLSANFLNTLNTKNLPNSLRVLELCANEISHLADLCIQPPPLNHLGLGHNKLTMVDDYITGEYWPHLLSLDLSHNNLCDLMDIVKKLQSVPKLRNLILQGNPLSLVPAYRGYAIDSLRKLDFLDDISISADERHHYKGLAKRKEYVLDEAKIKLEVKCIRGLPIPEELKNPDDQPEFPIVNRKYFVQFMFLEDKSANAEIFQILYDDHYSLSSPTQTQTNQDDGQTVTTARESLMPPPQAPGGSTEASSTQEKNVIFAEDVDTLATRPHSARHSEYVGGQEECASVRSANQSEALDGLSVASGALHAEGTQEPQHDPNMVQLAPVKSELTPWLEEVELGWTSVLTRDDLLALRNFFKQGMEIAVMEEKILSYPAEQDGANSPTGSQKGGKKDKKDKKDDKKDSGKDDGKKKKKKGEPEIDLTHMPPEYTTLATFHLPLQELLEGEFECEASFSQGPQDLDNSRTLEGNDPTTKKSDEDGATHSGDKLEGNTEAEGSSSSNMLEVELNVPTEMVAETISESPAKQSKLSPTKAKVAKPAKMDKKGKDGKKADSAKGKKDGKDGKKSPKGDKKDKNKGRPSMPELAEGEEAPIPPLEVDVAVHLHHWKTAMDSIREEEEKQSEMQQK